MTRRIAFPAFIIAFAALAAVVPANPISGPQLLSYRLEPRDPMKYRLVADVKGHLPIGDSIEASDITARLTFTYTASPKTRLSDGTSDVDFEVGAVDLEILKLPFSVPDDQARDLLNLTVTFARNGEVVKVVSQNKDAPFSVSVPGVDPKRLYALIFPIVFQKTPVKVGDRWAYKSELLGGQGTTPRFTATLLAAKKGAGNANTARLKQEFEMNVDQKVDADRKPAKTDEDVHRAKAGKIDGLGIYTFDKTRGRVTHGEVTIHANIKDSLVGKALTEDEPKELVSNVEAKVTIDLVSPASPSAAPVKSAPAVVAKGAGEAAKKEKP